MQGSVFAYNGSFLAVYPFTATDAEFNFIGEGLSLVWKMVSPEVTTFGLELVSLQYCPLNGELGAKLSNKCTYHIGGVRFHGKITAYDARCKILECIRRLGL